MAHELETRVLLEHAGDPALRFKNLPSSCARRLAGASRCSGVHAHTSQK